MRPLLQTVRGSFQTKVIVAAVVVMVVVLGFAGFMVNRRFTRRFETEAAQSLQLASAAFTQWQEIRGQALVDRFRGLAHEPRIKGVVTTGDSRTIRGVLRELLDQLRLDAVLVTGDSGERLSDAVRNPALRLADLASAAKASIERALEGQVNAEALVVDGRLVEVVSVPVAVGTASGGVLTFATEAGEEVAQQCRRLVASQVVLLDNDRVLASTFPARVGGTALLGAYRLFAAAERLPGASPREILLDGEHYLAQAGAVPSAGPRSRLGYMLLSSYERPLQELRAMQRTLLVLGLGGIVVGSFAIWLLLSQVMRPLQSLRCGAEAVGRGDFSRRVPVTGTDECGQLAEAFNRMTGNLELSRAQLERAHESLKSTQDQLIQREKLSAVGEFVAGVTHELNNPLAVIIGYAQLLQMESLNPEQEAYVRQIVGGVHRCRKITRSLLAFARQHPPERLDVDVNALLDETLGFIQYELRTGNIEVVRRLAPGLPPVHADPHQLQQVFLNIANNARQAMEEHAGRGRLVVTTEEAGPRVRITLQDDGPGISAENLGRLFTPFFTTKAVGKGTGLGMSVSYGIIQEHGGDIRAESRPGAGATFVIELPSGTGQAAVVTRPLETEAVPVLEAAGRSVLVVDDEEPLLELYRDALSRRGFRVEMAGDGEAALRRLEESRFDLVLCDMKMPGLNGQETYERLLARDRDAASRFIFITGDTLNERTRAFVQAQRRACLSKPFSLDEFYDAVRQVAEAG